MHPGTVAPADDRADPRARGFVEPSQDGQTSARWYLISVGVSCPLVDGKAIRTVTGTARPTDPEAAARWLEANLPAVLAADDAEAQRHADAYATAWAAKASELDTRGDLVTPRPVPKTPAQKRKPSRSPDLYSEVAA